MIKKISSVAVLFMIWEPYYYPELLHWNQGVPIRS